MSIAWNTVISVSDTSPESGIISANQSRTTRSVALDIRSYVAKPASITPSATVANEASVMLAFARGRDARC